MNVSRHVQFETNIDDMDPRLLPNVIDKLLAAGADDAWVTPIIMKKGRAAFTIGAMCRPELADDVRATFFRETTTIGVRQMPVDKYVLERAETTVEVGGESIRVKTAFEAGAAQNRSIEWDDVAAAAEALGLSAKDVLAAATAEAVRQADDP